jgi:hypothetical protein
MQKSPTNPSQKIMKASARPCGRMVPVTRVIEATHGRFQTLLVGFGFLAVGIGFPLACFLPEAHKALRLLTEIVEGSDTELQCWRREP